MRIAWPLLLATLLAPGGARARADLGAPQIRAARAASPIAVDGRLDEPAWRAAPPFAAFVQVFPGEGAEPSERTEVRVLYDARTLYVGVRCLDSRPGEIVRPLGRRDKPPGSDTIATDAGTDRRTALAGSDTVTVAIDAGLDRRTAFAFSLTAGGVQADALIYDDDRITYEWDAVWDGAISLDEKGWSAEFAIPLSVLRYPAARVQIWGFGVQREVGRSHEKMSSFPVPRGARGLVSRFGTLGGIEGIEPRTDFEVTPYLAARALLRPQFSSASKPQPRLFEPIGDAGVDLRARLGTLTLTGTVNPDFGQVEADQIIQNLTTFEILFPEKRPFFTQGLDVFQPVGAGNEKVPQQMLYSRRIGLEVPILGAAKLVGRASESVQVGLLDALVSGTGQRPGSTEEKPDRRLRWSWADPFQLSPGTAYPLVAPATQNFLAGVIRVEAAERLHLGAQATSALPLTVPCPLSQAQVDEKIDGREPVPGPCAARGGHAAALDFSVTSRGGEWYAYGQASGSQVVGGPTSRVLPDGVALRRGDSGLGSYLRAGKRGGEPIRFDLGWDYASPRLDLNAAGFQRTQNEQAARARLSWTRPSGSGPFHDWTAYAETVLRWTTDGRGLNRGRGVAIGADVLFRDLYLGAGCRAGTDFSYHDVREIEQTGVPLLRPGLSLFGCTVQTDEARDLSLSGEAWVAKNAVMRPFDAPWFYGASLGLAVRPHPRLETRLSAGYEVNRWGLRWVDFTGGTPYDPASWSGFVFAGLKAPTASLILRQLLVLTPRLTFQLYGQLYADYRRYGPFFGASRNLQATIRPEDLGTLPGTPAYDGHNSALVLNAVLRWELRPGSLLHLVYARNQAEPPLDPAAGPVPGSFYSVAPRALGRGPATDSVMVKWTFWLGP